MKARISPDMEQIKHYAQIALNGFGTLDLETAAEIAQGSLRDLLRYLAAFDHTDNTLAINLTEGVEQVIILEGFVRDL